MLSQTAFSTFLMTRSLLKNAQSGTDFPIICFGRISI
uniref:Uncharacterized protein n=1 Tax=Arundo donax TaxID=35708 RepID=A0A0A8ZEF7_ARUDO